MAIAMTLQRYLDRSGVDYDILPHPYTTSSMSTAEAAAVPGDKIAKSVILEDDQGYLMAVIPATHHIELGMLSHQLHRHFELATESEIATLFNDCVLGAIPPMGHPYGMRMIVDDSLQELQDVYFESGDHVDLVHMRSEDFMRLNIDASLGQFSRHI